jgi:hypothetical protein
MSEITVGGLDVGRGCPAAVVVGADPPHLYT